jgi:hypothetical protein
VFYLRHSSNWNPHRLHSEPFLFFRQKKDHNVGLLRFDDDHDHICYRLRRFKYLAEKVMSSNHYKLFKMVKKRLKLEEMIFNFDTTTWHNYFLENKIDVKVDFDSILLSK